MAKSFDVAVIGAGPGGYTAAIRAAQLGLNTVCIDDWKNPKGKPSLGRHLPERRLHPVQGAARVLGELRARAAQVRRARHHRKGCGRSTSRRCWRARTRSSIPSPAASRCCSARTRSPRCTAVAASSAGGDRVSDRGQEGEHAEVIEAKHVIIATGSVPAAACRSRRWTTSASWTTSGRCRLPQVPKRLGVIGAGVIGLEMGSVWRRLGSRGDHPRGVAGFPAGRRRTGGQGGAAGSSPK